MIDGQLPLLAVCRLYFYCYCTILLFIYVANSNMIYVMSLQFANDFGMHLVPRMHDHH